MAAASTWTPERVDLLKSLWAAGYSAGHIAVRIGNATRNAVIGKVHRLGLAKRQTTSRMSNSWRGTGRKPTSVPSIPRKPRAPSASRRSRRDPGFEFAMLTDREALATIEGIAPEDAAINRRPLAEVDRDDCHWPIGDPAKPGFGFCGAAALHGRSYCEQHAARAYRPG